MAKRFGGPHSNLATETGATQAVKTRGSFKERALIFIAFPLLIKAFWSDPLPMLQYGGAFFCFLLVSWLTSEGRKAQAAYEARKVARPPAIPRKLFGAIVTGFALFLAGQPNFGLIETMLFFVLGVALHIGAFGLDPMRKKGMEGMNEFDMQRVAKAVEKAEATLSEMTGAADRMTDRVLKARVYTLADEVREMFRTVEEDPRDLTGARKFLGVYLKGARDATIKFVDLYAKNKDETARQDYQALLSDLEASFAKQRETMLLDVRSDLDVEIEVLRDRLKQEGLRARQ